LKGTIVEKMNIDFRELIDFLDEKGEISLRSTVDGNFRKSLLLCVASYFEKALSEHVTEFIHEVSSQNAIAVEFVRNKAIRFQYHSWFAWEARNANKFFSLFGEEFKRFMERRIRENRELDASIRAFLEIGDERNRLVHQDFGSFSLEKTTTEIYELYERAAVFVDSVPVVLREFSIGPKK
jgi:RiboL-PSP-HEPN